MVFTWISYLSIKINCILVYYLRKNLITKLITVNLTFPSLSLCLRNLIGVFPSSGRDHDQGHVQKSVCSLFRDFEARHEDADVRAVSVRSQLDGKPPRARSQKFGANHCTNDGGIRTAQFDQRGNTNLKPLHLISLAVFI